jgi:hypothetical protein
VRHLFLGGVADWATALGADETSTSSQAGKRALFIPSATLTFWGASSGGTQYTDLLDGTGNPVTSVTADSAGELPEIQGPDTAPETWYMWMDGNNGAGPRRKVIATDIGEALTGQEADIAALAAGVSDNAADISDFQASIGSADGIASLDSSGKLAAAEIPDLDASRIVSGTLNTSRVPSLDASKIGSGTLATGRIPDLSSSYLTVTQKGSANGVASLASDGKLTAGQVVNPAVTGPTDQGLLAWSLDAAMLRQQFSPNAGVIYLARMELRRAATISTVAAGVATSGSGVSNGYLGLYDSTGTLLASTVAQSFDTIGYWPAALTSAISNAPAGLYWVALLIGSATSFPLFFAQNKGAIWLQIVNANLPAATSRFATNGSGLSALPAHITPASNSQIDGMSYWAAIA